MDRAELSNEEVTSTININILDSHLSHPRCAEGFPISGMVSRPHELTEIRLSHFSPDSEPIRSLHDPFSIHQNPGNHCLAVSALSTFTGCAALCGRPHVGRIGIEQGKHGSARRYSLAIIFAVAAYTRAFVVAENPPLSATTN
ncbi:hypothetical protein D9M69_516800 [compost metagenome]